MSFNDFLNKKIVVKQVRSQINLDRKQNACVVGLGLRGIGSTSTLTASESILGMVKKVEHIVKIELA